jgi:molecular chaperone DnaK
VFSTAEDNQTTVEIHVLQGEREMAYDNRTLARFQLTGLPAAPRGVPQIEVTFDIDANGIVHVSAKDLATQKEQSVKITASSGLSESDIQRMVKDAEVNAEEDKRKRERVTLKNNLDSTIYQTEKLLKDNGDKVPAATRAELEAVLGDAKTAVQKEDGEAMKKQLEKLTALSHKLAEDMYRASTAGQPGGAQSAPGGEAKKDDEPIEAEFREEKGE